MEKKDIVTVTLKREVPYSQLTDKEKINLAYTSNRDELLELLATDESLEVREALLKRSQRIPDRILCEVLINSENEYIRSKAKERLYSETIFNNWHNSMFFFEKLYVFLCEFFGVEFTNELNEFGTKHRRLALSAIYLYELRYSFFGSQWPLFKIPFAIKKSSYAGWNIVFCSDIKNDEIWEILKRMAYYKYIPEERDAVMEKGLLSDAERGNIHELQNWIKDTEPQEDMKNNWIDILAKTLFNLGSPWNNKAIIDRMNTRITLGETEDLELIEKAEEALKNMYRVTAIETVFTKSLLRTK